MKTLFLLVLLAIGFSACATFPLVVRDNTNCPGLSEVEKTEMFRRAESARTEREAERIRDEASICDALYISFLNGIMPNRAIGKQFAEESVAAFQNSEYYRDILERYKGGSDL